MAKPNKKISRNDPPAAAEQAASTPLASSVQEGPATETAPTATSETLETVQAQPASGELSTQRQSDLVDPATGLRLDGPTIEQWVAAGYDASKYPPQGYAAKKAPAGLASTFRSELPGGGFRPPPSVGEPSTCRSEAE